MRLANDHANGVTPLPATAPVHFAVVECALGSLLVAQSPRGICAILLGDDPAALANDLQQRFPGAQPLSGDSDFEAVVAQVARFVAAPASDLDLPLDMRGSAFQQRVWRALQTIAPGSTASYRAIADQIGAPNAARAVAGACAANALAVAIPCHRVLRQDGGLSGYRWGVERKQALLAREVSGR
jgi:AraC family transcriptional regulator of adaptative response/methylated-DNA-[protein]-cysteine methyltransferase